MASPASTTTSTSVVWCLLFNIWESARAPLTQRKTGSRGIGNSRFDAKRGALMRAQSCS